ncbi:uncharacterized protein LOC126654789 [Mercurialis annua]|uniref:uncharacterized protein LOC126654789 n=1 Tax=Mercurialis annua TaxID=3986 RepID=UPI002160A1BE|nr:uncharacterized protein LOC126654789 [Mercurialis annua]
MASVQDEAAPIKELVTDEQVEKPYDQGSPLIEEKPETGEENEVLVHDHDHDEDEEDETIHNEVKEYEDEEDKFAGSPIIGEDETTTTFDEEAEGEEGDLI